MLSSPALASTFESPPPADVGHRAVVAAQVLVLAGRLGFPDEQAAAAIGRGQQLAVGAELDGIDPVGVLANLVQQLAGLRREDAHDAAGAAQGDQRVRGVDVGGQHGVELVADLGDALAGLHVEEHDAARMPAAAAADQQHAAVAAEPQHVAECLRGTAARPAARRVSVL